MANVNESHPAFYHSKKIIWDYPITSPSSNSVSKSWRGRLANCCVVSFDSLWKLWYLVFLLASTWWLTWLAIGRYLEFKAQAFHPRFGIQWDWSFPMNLQVGCLVLIISLIPLLIYSAVSRVGHAANDGILLGRDCLHLHAMLSQALCLQAGITGGQRTGDSEAAERLRSHLAHSTASLNNAVEPDFESFIIEDTERGCCSTTRRQLRPFAGIIHAIIAFAFVLPVAVFEAEQMRNEAIDPKYVWHSNLNWLINGASGSHGSSTGIQATGTDTFKNMIATAAVAVQNSAIGKIPSPESNSTFPSHSYPTKPTEISLEFALLAVSLVILIIRLASPFWFTSRSFSIILSIYTAVTGCYILVEAAALELLVKIFTAGSRDSRGIHFELIPQGNQLLGPWASAMASGISPLFLLTGLMAFYAFGELQFQQSVTNYAKLIMSGDFDTPNADDVLVEEKSPHGLVIAPGDCDQLKNAEFMYGPSVIAVTTKPWRPPPKLLSRKNTITLATSCATTPIPFSGSSDLTGTICSQRTLNTNTEPTPMGKAKKENPSVAFWPALVSAIAFVILLITRACLIGPMLQCYWKINLRLPLFFVVFSIFYLIMWLVLWFGVTVKTAWRFRLLHMPSPTSVSRSRFSSPKHKLQNERLGASQFAPWPMMNNPRIGGNYFYPWLQYHPGYPQPSAGSLTFGNSPTPYDTTRPGEIYVERGPSAVDSVYGCFTDMVPASAAALAANMRHVASGGLLRAGPPTLSDESDNVLPIDVHRGERFTMMTDVDGKMHPSTSNSQLTNYAYLKADVKGQHHITEFGNSSPCDAGSYDVNQDSDDCQTAFLSVNAIRANLDPNYASLVGLANGRARSPDYVTTKGVPNRSMSARRIAPTRVTFKTLSEDQFEGNREGNNGSSDSGVCTNWSGPGRGPVGKLSISNLPLFPGNTEQAIYQSQISPRGFIATESPVRLENDDRLCSQV